MNINKFIPDPRGKEGDHFVYRTGKVGHDAWITGYRVTIHGNGDYRVEYEGRYNLNGQEVALVLPLSTVDRQLISEAKV